MAETLNEALARHGLGKGRVEFRGKAAPWLTRDGETIGPMDAAAGWCLVALMEGRPMPAAASAWPQERARQLLRGLRAMDAAKAAEGET